MADRAPDAESGAVSGAVPTSGFARVLGIAGGSCAGKTTLAVAMVERLGDRAVHLPFDEYYRDHGHLTPDERALVNYDHPDSLDHELFLVHLSDLAAGRPVEVPVYDFATHCRTDSTRRLDPGSVVVVDGILLFAVPGIRECLDLLVYVDVPGDVRLARRVERDVSERGRTEESVRAQFAATVAPMHELFVAPHRADADVVIRGEGDMGHVVDDLVQRLG